MVIELPWPYGIPACLCGKKRINMGNRTRHLAVYYGYPCGGALITHSKAIYKRNIKNRDILCIVKSKVECRRIAKGYSGRLNLNLEINILGKTSMAEEAEK